MVSDDTLSPDALSDDDSSVLLLVPADGASDDRQCTAFLTQSDPDHANVLSVTLAESPAERLAVWTEQVGDQLPKRAAVVDGRFETGTESGGAPSELEVTVMTQGSGLQDIGLTIAEQLGEWKTTPEPTYLCLHGLSTLASGYPTDALVEFCTSLNRLSARLDVRAHHHLDPTECSEATLERVAPTYDTVLVHTPEGWEERPTDSVQGVSRQPRHRPTPADAALTAYGTDTVFQVLSASLRRGTLYVLTASPDEPLSVSDLAKRVRNRSTGGPAETESLRKLEIELAHRHLPELADIGLIEYDRETGQVRYQAEPAFDSWVQYLSTVERS